MRLPICLGFSCLVVLAGCAPYTGGGAGGELGFSAPENDDLNTDGVQVSLVGHGFKEGVGGIFAARFAGYEVAPSSSGSFIDTVALDFMFGGAGVSDGVYVSGGVGLRVLISDYDMGASERAALEFLGFPDPEVDLDTAVLPVLQVEAGFAANDVTFSAYFRGCTGDTDLTLKDSPGFSGTDSVDAGAFEVGVRLTARF